MHWGAELLFREMHISKKLISKEQKFTFLSTITLALNSKGGDNKITNPM